MVTFRQHNVYHAPLPSEFDVVFFRNVLIYFSLDAARRVIDNITTMLSPRGYLFLGSAETLRGISDAFHVLHTNGAFYYQRGAAGERRPGAAPALVQFASPTLSYPAESDLDSSWFDDIQRSTSRIQQLRQQDPGPVASATPLTDQSARQSHNQGREELTLSAVLHLNQGDVSSAEQECRRLLEYGSMDASAHYLMALCREQRGDIDGAIQQDEIAAYLDPTFAMPQLHMGMLGCRHGSPEAGRRRLEKSLELLRSEDVSRILLLGGGFHRQSLMTMCERELARCRRKRA